MISVAARLGALALLLAYEGLVALWIYYVLRPAEIDALGVAVATATAVAGIVLGAYGRSWWLVLAPAAAPLFAIPAGDYHRGTEVPVWYAAALLGFPGLALWIAVGVASIKLFKRYSAGRRRVR